MSTDATTKIAIAKRMTSPKIVAMIRVSLLTLQPSSSDLSSHSTNPLHLTALIQTILPLKILAALHVRSLAEDGKYSKHVSSFSSELSGHCGIPSHDCRLSIQS